MNVCHCAECDAPDLYCEHGVNLADAECSICAICGLCGQPGADKIPHPVHWPGERRPDRELVHAACEHAACGEAHGALSDAERESFLRSLW